MTHPFQFPSLPECATIQQVDPGGNGCVPFQNLRPPNMRTDQTLPNVLVNRRLPCSQDAKKHWLVEVMNSTILRVLAMLVHLGLDQCHGALTDWRPTQTTTTTPGCEFP